jgi:hypothetical protein
MKKNTQTIIQLSPYFTYYVTRVDIARQSPLQDAGASVKNALKSLVYYGSCMDDKWPSDYKETKETLDNKPSDTAYDDALNYQVVSYARIITVNDVNNDGPTTIKTMLSSGYPVLSAINIYGNCFDNAVNGVVITPHTFVGASIGHAIVFVGYDNDGYIVKEVRNSKAKYKFKNSWGTLWGDDGYGYLDEDFINNGFVYESWCVFQNMLKIDDNFTIIAVPPDISNNKNIVKTQLDDIFEQIKRLADFSKQSQVINMLERLKIKYNQNVPLSNFIDDIQSTVVNSLAEI